MLEVSKLSHRIPRKVGSVVCEIRMAKDRKHRHSNYTICNLLGTAGHGFGLQATSCKELSACLFDFSGGKLPVGSDEVARITVRIALQIVLVLGLGFPKVPGRPHFCDNLSRPEARRVHVGNSLFCDEPLLLARVKDGGPVARPAVIPLAIQGSWIVDLKEILQELPETHFLRIKDDFDGFGVTAMVAVSRVPHIASAVAHTRRNHAGVAADQILHSPETSAG